MDEVNYFVTVGPAGGFGVIASRPGLLPWVVNNCKTLEEALLCVAQQAGYGVCLKLERLPQR